MHILIIAVLFILAVCPYAAADLPRSRPEAQGVSSSAIRAFVQAADKDIDAVMRSCSRSAISRTSRPSASPFETG